MSKVRFSAEDAKRIFDTYDKSGKGHMDAKSFADLSVAVIGAKLSEEQAEMALKIMDKDGNGTIEFSEFMEFWNDGGADEFKEFQLPEKILEETQKIYELFKELDTDGNGVLDKDEMQVLFDKAGFNEKQTAELWDEMDIDRNGVVCFAEFVILLMNTLAESESSDDESGSDSE